MQFQSREGVLALLARRFVPTASEENGDRSVPRYFLDLHGEQSTTRDTAGIECADENAAGVFANRLLAEIAAHEPITAGQKTLLASVRDEAGRVVYASTLNLTGTRLRVPANVPPTQIILQVA